MRGERFLRRLRSALPGRRPGEAMPLPTEDRRVLEQVIFPHLLADRSLKRYLFVGCEYYTSHYVETFRSREFWTIEPDEHRSRSFGGRRRVNDRLENVTSHFEPGYFDALVCNGVFGCGLNDRPNVEAAFAGCFEVLREGGLLVHGWNDIPELRPFDLSECSSLQRFTPWEFPPLGGSRYQTGTINGHTFDFYRR
jgi:hypothetical protein